jgi:hypothetical protein
MKTFFTLQGKKKKQLSNNKAKIGQHQVNPLYLGIFEFPIIILRGNNSEKSDINHSRSENAMCRSKIEMSFPAQ